MFEMKVAEKDERHLLFPSHFVCNCYSFLGKSAKFIQPAKNVMLSVHFPTPLEL
jgi:hypothetical protein